MPGPTESLLAAGVTFRPAEAGDDRDFGKYLAQPPALVATPQSVDELARAIGALFAQGAPYVLRATAHSSGGQTLTSSVQIATAGVTGIVARDDAAGWIDVLGGTRWLDVAEALRPDRRPVSLTDNLATTVGGTLAAGGVGDRAWIDGLQLASVLEVEWIAPDGTRRVVTRADPELGFLLGGRGQLGAFGRVRLATIARARFLAGHIAAWDSIAAYARAVAQLTWHPTYEVMRATLFWRRTGAINVRAILASFVEPGALSPALDEARLHALRPFTGDVIEPGDRHEVAAQPRTWSYACPALELALPWDQAGLDALHEVLAAVDAAGLRPHLPDGIALAVTRIVPGLPLAPTPGTGACCFLAIRPQLATGEAAHAFEPALRAIGDLALDRGGKLYLIGVESERGDFLDRQFGAALAPWRALKDQLDPARLCNRWKL